MAPEVIAQIQAMIAEHERARDQLLAEAQTHQGAVLALTGLLARFAAPVPLEGSESGTKSE